MKSRLNVGMRCTSVSEICVEIPCLVGAKSGVTAPRTSTAESWTACAVSGASTRVASERLTSTRSRLNGWNPIARTATVYGPPTSKPCTRYWPFERVRTEVVNPVPRLVTCTAASATGWPWGSVTLPVIAPVVTPWARATPAQSMVKSAAATRARPEPTIQRMDGPLLRRNGCRVQVTIETGRKWSARGTPSRMLGGCFTKQIHSRDRNEKIGSPCRQHRRQDASRTDCFRELKHQQHDESRGEARRDTPGRAALGTRDRERRAEQCNQETDERNRDLERQLDLQLLGVRAAPRQRIDIAPQLAIAHFVRPFRLGEQIHRSLRHGASPQGIEFEGRLAAGLVAGEIAQRPAIQRPERAGFGRGGRLSAVAINCPLSRQHDRRVRRARSLTLQQQIRHLPRPQLERANRVHPAAVGAVYEVVAGARGSDRFFAQHLEAVRRGDRSDLAEQQAGDEGGAGGAEQRPHQPVKRDARGLRRGELGVPAERPHREHRRGQRHGAGLDPARHVGVELVGQIDDDDENREAEQRDEEDAQPLAKQVAVEGPQCDLHSRFRIFPTQPNSASFSSSQSPPCAVLPARRTDRSRGIATIRKIRYGAHIAKNGGTISRSPSSSPPIRPT